MAKLLVTETEQDDSNREASKDKFRKTALSHGYISVNLNGDVQVYHHPTHGHVIVVDHHSFFHSPNSNGTYGKFNISVHKSKDLLNSSHLGYGHDDFESKLKEIHKGK